MGRWLLYPKDPAAHYHPTFYNLSTFLQFVGRGENGLLGYCKQLSTHEREKLYRHFHAMSSHFLHKVHVFEQLVQELKELISKKDMEISKLEDNITNMKRTPLGSRERRVLSSIETLAPNVGARKRRVMATKYVGSLNFLF